MTLVLRAALIAALVPTLLAARVQNAPRPAPPPARHGFHAEFFANLDDVQQKIMALAESTPAEKFSWRPAPGVRSTSEVYMHVVGGNYFLASFLGADTPPPNGDLEKRVTRKADVLAELRKSFDHLRTAAGNATDLEQRVRLFGKQTTARGVLLTILTHLHEHLGQSIAYARMAGVVPPWSR